MKTHSIASFESPFRTRLELVRQTFTSTLHKPARRVAFVTGLHGDELEGLYAGHRLLQFLEDLKRNHPGAFLGEVHVYPAANPQALNHASRLWPGHGTDLNRSMGQSNGGRLPGQIAHRLLDDLREHADLVVDLHASNMHLRELPQVRVVEEFQRKVLPLARLTNCDLIWVHPMADLFASTLGYNLNRIKIPTLVIEAGICLRVTREFGDQLFAGFIHLLKETGVLDASVPSPGRIKIPLEIRANQVQLATAGESGLFVPEAQPGEFVGAGRVIGHILDPVKGRVLEEVTAPASGLLFTLREMPLTYAGSLLARVALEREPPP